MQIWISTPLTNDGTRLDQYLARIEDLSHYLSKITACLFNDVQPYYIFASVEATLRAWGEFEDRPTYVETLSGTDFNWN